MAEVHEPFHLSYWKDEADGRRYASGREGASAVTVEVDGRYYPTFDFELPAQQNDFEKLTRALALAFRNGRKSKAADMRAALAE